MITQAKSRFPQDAPLAPHSYRAVRCFDMTLGEGDVMPSDVLDLIDAKGIAAELGVHVVTVRKLLSTGELPSTKVGNRRLVRRRDLVKFIDDRIDGRAY